jgi:putative DNA primase/helicase
MTAILKHSVDDVYSAATLALSEGLSVFPPAQDGTKRPDGPWMHYQTEAPTTDELDQWYEGTGRTGVGVVCGAVSGGLEMLEFEGRAIGVIPEFKELCTAAGLFELFHRIATGYYETTPSGGVHLLYRCEEVDGNTALARNEDGEILIETRGEGGFCITAPIFGAVHPSGEPWTLRRGGFSTIVTISGTERHELHRLCRSLDRYQRERSVIGAIDQAAVTNGLRPDDDYNQRATWPEILEPLRWVPLYTARDGNQHWRRPGKELGTSVTVSDNGAGVFYCFSSSAAPFEPDTPYSKFGAVTVLEHGGDFKAAARALAKQGYGDVLTMPADNSETMGALSDGWLNTDSGNSSRLIRLAGDELRYVHKWGRFLVYKQGRWVIDEKDAIVGEVAKGVARKIMGGLKDLASSEQRDREFKWAKHSEGGAAIGHMVRLSRGVPGVLVQHEELDADPHLLNVRNGTIDLYTGELRIHDPAT